MKRKILFFIFTLFAVLSFGIFAACDSAAASPEYVALVISFNRQTRRTEITATAEYGKEAALFENLTFEAQFSDGNYNAVASYDSVEIKNLATQETFDYIPQNLAAGNYKITFYYRGKSGVVNLNVTKEERQPEISVTVTEKGNSSSTFAYAKNLYLYADITVDGKNYDSAPYIYYLDGSGLSEYQALSDFDRKQQYLADNSTSIIVPEYEQIDDGNGNITDGEFIGYKFFESDDFCTGTFYPFASLYIDGLYIFSEPEISSSFTLEKGDIRLSEDLGVFEAYYNYSGDVTGKIALGELYISHSGNTVFDYVEWVNSADKVDCSDNLSFKKAKITLSPYYAARYDDISVDVALYISQGNINAPYFDITDYNLGVINGIYNYGSAVIIPLGNVYSVMEDVENGLIFATDYSVVNAGSYTATFTLADPVNYRWSAPVEENGDHSFGTVDEVNAARSFNWTVSKNTQGEIYIQDETYYNPQGNAFDLQLLSGHEYYAAASWSWEIVADYTDLEYSSYSVSADELSFNLTVTKCGIIAVRVYNAGDDNFEPKENTFYITVNKIDLPYAEDIKAEVTATAFDVTVTNYEFTVTDDMIPSHDPSLDGGAWELGDYYSTYNAGDSVTLYDKTASLILKYLPEYRDLYNDIEYEITITVAKSILNQTGTPINYLNNSGKNAIIGTGIFDLGNLEISFEQVLYFVHDNEGTTGEIKDDMTITGIIDRQGRYVTYDDATETYYYHNGRWVSTLIEGVERTVFIYTDQNGKEQTVVISDAETVKEYYNGYDFYLYDGSSVSTESSSVLDGEVIDEDMNYATLLERAFINELMASSQTYESYSYTEDYANQTTRLVLNFGKEDLMKYQYIYSLDTSRNKNDSTNLINGSVWAGFMYNNYGAENGNFWNAKGSLALDADAEGKLTEITFAMTFTMTGAAHESSVKITLTPTETAITAPDWLE